jgi:outer membrane protein OmpA-like peptidoglycan-associated protein
MALVLALAAGLYAQEDVEGSKDHPLVSRLDNFVIDQYEEFDYDSATFYDRNDKEYVIEGHKWVISYTLKEGVTSAGQLKIRQNYINAARKIGGEILNETGMMKIVKDGKEVWIDLWVAGDGRDYRLTIVERTAMKQEVVADPQALLGDIRTTGHAAVYGIYFDTDSAVIKAESEPTITSIADLLKADPSLKLYVVGHTDMTGTLEHNMDLSAKRAQSVVDALVSKHGIAAGRLAAKGVGPLSPVGTNTTEEGRKLNRRVELVAMQ